MIITFTDDERTVFEEMRRVGAFRTDEDTVKGALWWYAHFLDIDVPAELFAVGRPRRRPPARCDTCHGTGEIEVERDVSPSEATGGLSVATGTVPCPTCAGAAEVAS